MIGFLLLSACVTLVVIGVLIKSMNRPEKLSLDREEVARLQPYQQRYQELEQDRDSGMISESEFNESVDEISRSLLADNQLLGGQAEREDTGKPIQSMLAVGIAIPVFTLLVYLVTGSPQSITRPAEVVANVDTTNIDVNAMVRQLEQRLENEPDDLRGWHMLTRSYMTLGRYDDAIVAAEKLNALQPDEPAFIVMLIDARLMANKGTFTSEIQQLIDRNLALSAGDAPTLWLAGMAAYKRQDYDKSREYWDRLLLQLDADSEVRLKVEQLLQQIESESG